jgi:hypothetical protein
MKYMNMIENCLISKNPKTKLIERCSKEFGITEDPCEGGFLLENGKFLDFSGKIDGSPSGVRSYDHRDIGRCINSESCKGIQSFHEFRLIGMHGNAIRFHTSGCRSDTPVVNVILYNDQNPTDKQWEVIRKSAKENGGIIYDILNKEGDRIHSGSIEAKKAGRLRILLETLK